MHLAKPSALVSGVMLGLLWGYIGIILLGHQCNPIPRLNSKAEPRLSDNLSGCNDGPPSPGYSRVPSGLSDVWSIQHLACKHRKLKRLHVRALLSRGSPRNDFHCYRTMTPIYFLFMRPLNQSKFRLKSRALRPRLGGQWAVGGRLLRLGPGKPFDLLDKSLNPKSLNPKSLKP